MFFTYYYIYTFIIIIYLCILSIEFGDTFAEIGAREPQPRASQALVRFAEYHRQMERQGLMLIKALKPVKIKIVSLCFIVNITYLHF